jgi:hypothetical protein
LCTGYCVLGIAPIILTARMISAWAKPHDPGLATCVQGSGSFTPIMR